MNGSEGTLTYTGAPGQPNSVDFVQQGPGTGTVRVRRADSDPITPSGTCRVLPGTIQYECTGIARVVADGADLDDDLYALDLIDIDASLTGSGGADRLVGGHAASVLDGGDGPDSLAGLDGDSRLLGGNGNDSLQPGEGNDVSGGADADRLFLRGEGNPAPDLSVTLNDVADDRTPGGGGNIHSDIEDVDAGSYNSAPPAPPGTVIIVGSAGPNVLTGFSGRLDITGGAGNDDLRGGSYDDRMNSRDGFADRVLCGDGEDSAIVDTLDVVSSDCETIETEEVAPPATAAEDRPPTVSFTEPAGDGTRLGTSAGTTLTATASDDRGVARVVFLDDERVLCEVVAPPYTCEYEPRGEDVGRNTLTAVAVDSSEQTATALRTVTVGLFATPSVSSEGHARSMLIPLHGFGHGAPAGKAWPGGRPARDGVVTLRVKAGRRTVAKARNQPEVRLQLPAGL